MSPPQVSHVVRRDFVRSPLEGAPSSVGIGGMLPTGSQATRRAAMAAVSDAVQSPRGRRATVAANDWMAALRGISANRAASSHGSRPSRVRADNTVSVPVFSSPIGAKRKSLYCEWTREYSGRYAMRAS